MSVNVLIRWIVAFTLLIAVITTFVSPAFDIPKTTLYANSLAQLILLALIALASFPAGSLVRQTVIGRTSHDEFSLGLAPSVGLVLPLLC